MFNRECIIYMWIVSNDGLYVLVIDRYYIQIQFIICINVDDWFFRRFISSNDSNSVFIKICNKQKVTSYFYCALIIANQIVFLLRSFFLLTSNF